MIEVFVNESHDWVIVRNNNEVVHEGHNISITDFCCLLREFGHEVKDYEIDDRIMEEGHFAYEEFE